MAQDTQLRGLAEAALEFGKTRKLCQREHRTSLVAAARTVSRHVDRPLGGRATAHTDIGSTETLPRQSHPPPHRKGEGA